MVSIGKWLLYGIIGAFAISALVRPEQAYATTQAFSGVGSALGSLGGGIQSLLTGTGTGVAKLFNPLFTLRDLIYTAQAGAQTPKDIQELTSIGAIQSTPQYIADIQTIERQPGTPSLQAPQISQNLVNLSNQGFVFGSNPSISPMATAPSIVHGQSLPLSQEAINYYQQLGVTVSPESSETVASQNSSNGGGVSSASSNYSAGAAQAAGYSTGSPR